MREIVSKVIETNAVSNDAGTTTEVSCVVGSEQASDASVQVSLIDAATDASLVVTVEKTLDLNHWASQTTTGSFSASQTSIVSPFDCSGIGWIRARVTTAGATATRAKVTFILTRTN
jgi:hypothetical protein